MVFLLLVPISATGWVLWLGSADDGSVGFIYGGQQEERHRLTPIHALTLWLSQEAGAPPHIGEHISCRARIAWREPVPGDRVGTVMLDCRSGQVYALRGIEWQAEAR